MFEDLIGRAQLHADNVASEDERKKEAKMIMIDVVRKVVPEIEALGFVGVEFYNHDTEYFHLRIQARKGSEYYAYTFNIEFSSIHPIIYYGHGAHSAKGTEMRYDYNWNDSKLVATMKSALRAVVSEALKALEVNKIKGWV